MRHPARCGNGPLGYLLYAEGQSERGSLQSAEDLREVRRADPNGSCEFAPLDAANLEVCCKLFHADSFNYKLNTRPPRTLANEKFRLQEPFAIQGAWL